MLISQPFTGKAYNALARLLERNPEPRERELARRAYRIRCNEALEALIVRDSGWCVAGPRARKPDLQCCVSPAENETGVGREACGTDAGPSGRSHAGPWNFLNGCQLEVARRADPQHFA